MRRTLTLLAALLLAVPTTVACFPASCLGPVQTLSPQAMAGTLGPPTAGEPTRPNQAACQVQVEYDRGLYSDTRASVGIYSGWTLTDADLTPIGHATQGPPSFRYVDDSVYAIRGIDPGDAIAMHADIPGGIVVLVSSRLRFLPELCEFLQEPSNDPTLCAPVSPSPAGSGRTGSQTAP